MPDREDDLPSLFELNKTLLETFLKRVSYFRDEFGKAQDTLTPLAQVELLDEFSDLRIEQVLSNDLLAKEPRERASDALRHSVAATERAIDEIERLIQRLKRRAGVAL